MKPTASETMFVNLASLRWYDLCRKVKRSRLRLPTRRASSAASTCGKRRQDPVRSNEKPRAAGAPLPTRATVRDALADAALMLLAVDGPGVEQIETVLYNVFQTNPGTVLRVIRDVKEGKMRSKLVQA